MAKQLVLKGTTSYVTYIFIQNSSVTTGAGLTGLVFNSASLTCYYVRPLAAAVAVTLVTQTVTGAYSSGGFVEVSAANMPGVYRLDIPNAALASGVDSVVLELKGATNMAPVLLEIQLTSLNVNDAVRGGMTALPNANANAAGGLPISTAGALNMDLIKTDTAAILIDTDVIGAAGAGLTNISLPNQTMNITGNLTGSVGSVTGAVGSVTGAVGSVTGSVGSVTGAVGSVTGSVGSVVGHTAQTGDTFALANGANGFVATKADTAAILIDTAELQTDDIPGILTTLNDLSAAEVNAEVVDALNVDTYAEPGQGVPSATTTLANKLSYLFKWTRNKQENDGTTTTLYNAAGTVVDQKRTTSESAGTVTNDSIVSGP